MLPVNPTQVRPLLYVAAPYTRPEPVSNTHHVYRVATAVYADTGWCPVVPHSSLLWHLVNPQEESYWYEYDLHLLRGCDAIVRLPGYSVGADNEMMFARDNGIEVVEFESLPQSAKDAWGSR